MTSAARDALCDREYLDKQYEAATSSDTLLTGVYGTWKRVTEDYDGNVTLVEVKTALDYHGIAEMSNTSQLFEHFLSRNA